MQLTPLHAEKVKLSLGGWDCQLAHFFHVAVFDLPFSGQRMHEERPEKVPGLTTVQKASPMNNLYLVGLVAIGWFRTCKVIWHQVAVPLSRRQVVQVWVQVGLLIICFCVLRFQPTQKVRRVHFSSVCSNLGIQPTNGSFWLSPGWFYCGGGKSGERAQHPFYLCQE